MLWHNYYFQHFTKSDKESMQIFFFHFTKTLTHLTTNILLYKILRRPNVWGDLKWPHWGQCKIKLQHCNEAISQFYCCRRSMLIFPVKKPKHQRITVIWSEEKMYVALKNKNKEIKIWNRTKDPFCDWWRQLTQKHSDTRVCAIFQRVARFLLFSFTIPWDLFGTWPFQPIIFADFACLTKESFCYLHYVGLCLMRLCINYL